MVCLVGDWGDVIDNYMTVRVTVEIKKWELYYTCRIIWRKREDRSLTNLTSVFDYSHRSDHSPCSAECIHVLHHYI